MRHSQSIYRRFLLHAVLIAGAALFALPFVWMVGTSMMNEQEMFRPGVHVLPRAPQPRLVSPYLDDQEFPLPTRPAGLAETSWLQSRRQLLFLVRHRVSNLLTGTADDPRSATRPADPSVPILDNPEGYAAEPLLDEVVKGVWQRMVQAIDPELWRTNDENYRPLVYTSVSQEMVDDVLDKVRRRLCLGRVSIRTSDFRHVELAREQSPAILWKPLVGDVRLQDITEADQQFALVHYDLAGQDGWTLETVLDSPVPLEEIRSFTVAMRQDQTWHHLEVAVEFAGQRWQADEPLYLGGWQWQQLLLKKWDPDTYDPYEAHPWIWLKASPGGSAFHEPGKVRVVLTARKATPLQAWHGKAAHNYRLAWKHVPMWRYAATSFALVALNIVLMVLSSSLAAYAFARLQWPGRDFMFVLLLGTLMIPHQVTLIPGFIIMKSLGWYNTLNPLWIGAAFGSAFNIFLLRQFMRGIPTDLEDAARIDGCGFLRIWWHIMLPLVKPTLAAIAVFTFIGTWNDFMTPLIYLNDQRLYPLSLGLFQLQTMIGGNYAMMMAGSIMMTIPVIAVFFFAQKYFVQGITLTGMKA